MLRDRDKSLERPMKDKGPDSQPRPEGVRKRKNDSHELIGKSLVEAYRNVENEPLPDNLLEILNRIPDQSSDKERP
jgi:predicted RNA-binding protein with PUA domain